MPEKSGRKNYWLQIGAAWVTGIATVAIAFYTASSSNAGQDFILSAAGLEDVYKNNADLQRQIGVLETEYNQSKERIIELDNKIITLESELAAKDRFISDLQNSHRSAIENLNKIIDNRDKEIKDLEQILNVKPTPTSTPTITPEPPEPDELFFDNFDSSAKINWSPTSGNWTTQFGAYTVTDTALGKYYSYLPLDNDWGNYAIDVDVMNISNESRFAIMVRTAGRENFAGFYYTGSEVPEDIFSNGGYSCIVAYLDNNETSCQKIDGDLPSKIHLRIEVTGSEIVVTLNNVFFARLQGGFPSSGMPALFIGDKGNGLAFDNYKASKL